MHGRIAVAMTTMNRVRHLRFPNTVCDVITEGRNWKGNPIRHKCQFSWWCDGKSDKPFEKAAWENAKVVASAVLAGYEHMTDMTGGSLWYHADYVKHPFFRTVRMTKKIDTHIFYGE